MKMENNNKPLCRSLKNDTRGLSSVEYLILLVLIGVAGIGLWKKLGGTINTQATAADGTLGGMSATPSPSP